MNDIIIRLLMVRQEAVRCIRTVLSEAKDKSRAPVVLKVFLEVIAGIDAFIRAILSEMKAFRAGLNAVSAI